MRRSFNNADYLSLIEGNGLNPLLQNYWMTIHPPTLFLGFASTIVPFAYAVGGLLKKDYTGMAQAGLAVGFVQWSYSRYRHSHGRGLGV
jgi:cytochrome c-type biogenesis protein CcmF